MIRVGPNSSHLPSIRSNTPALAGESPLEYPTDSVAPARNNRPVVLLHGTIVEKEGISAYHDFALRTGHPVNYRTYPTITKGGRIEKSTDIASRQVNLSRAEVAAANLDGLKDLDRDGLRSALQMDSHLYGRADSSVEKTLDLMPGLLKDLQTLLAQPKQELETHLSGQLKRTEAKFAKSLENSGVKAEKAKQMAGEVLDSIAPKAILIGHSAGGYVAHNMAVNPEVTPDDDKYTYDGGNGVGEVLVLSAPIEGGLAKPAPPGVAGLPFYNFDKSVLRPIEQLPTSQLALLNPIVAGIYFSSKALLKSLSATNFMVTAQLTAPATYMLRPGNQQVEEGSEFFNTYIKDKPIPEGVSVITFTSPLDQLSQEDRSALITDEPNGNTLSVDLGVSKEDVERERPTWTHVIMTEKPDYFKEQFAENLAADNQQLNRVLDRRNDEGVRYEALTMVQAAVAKNPGLLDSKPGLRKALTEVAKEKLPFTDSASYLAYKILNPGK